MRFTQEISIFNPKAIEYAVTSLGTRITQTAAEIRLEAEQTLSNYSTTIQMNSAISQKADQITSEVSQTYATIGSLNSTASALSSKISQTAHTISLSVSGTAGNTQETGAGITITLKDENGETISSGEGKVVISGNVVFKSNLSDGTTTISGNNITTGTISAARIAANSISVSKLTGSISNGQWKIDLDNGTFTIGNISANNITTGTLTGRDISGGRILQTVSGASHGDIWGSGSSFVTQASIQNGIVRAGQYVLNGVNILAEGVDWDGAGSPGVQVCGHLSTVGTIWAGDEATDRFRVNCRGNIWTQNIWVNNLGGWITDYVWSDRRHKDNIKTIDYEKAANFIELLKPVSFVYTDRVDKGIHHGFIAQDVQEIAYDDWGIVKESENPNTGEKYLTLSYDDIIADLVATVQSQNERIKALEGRE